MVTTDGPDTVTRSDPRPFEAVLYPNRPLERAGFILVMLGVSSASFAMGVAFALAGAWPVTGFLGLDVLLLYFAFRAARRQGQRFEHIRLDASGLHVRRFDPNGVEQDWWFEPYWVRVEFDDEPQRHSRLTLASHDLQLRIGTFLTQQERLELARALRGALQEYR